MPRPLFPDYPLQEIPFNRIDGHIGRSGRHPEPGFVVDHGIGNRLRCGRLGFPSVQSIQGVGSVVTGCYAGLQLTAFEKTAEVGLGADADRRILVRVHNPVMKRPSVFIRHIFEDGDNTLILIYRNPGGGISNGNTPGGHLRLDFTQFLVILRELVYFRPGGVYDTSVISARCL